MKNDGVIKVDKLKVTTVKDKDVTSTIVIPNTKTEESEFVSVTVETQNAKEVQGTPIGKDGKPSGETVKKPVKAGKRTVEIVFAKTPKAARIVVVAKKDGNKPVELKVISVKACAEKDGKFEKINA